MYELVLEEDKQQLGTELMVYNTEKLLCFKAEWVSVKHPVVNQFYISLTRWETFAGNTLRGTQAQRHTEKLIALNTDIPYNTCEQEWQMVSHQEYPFLWDVLVSESHRV